MSRLEEKILKLCPDGIRYFPLSELADISTGKHNTKEQLVDGKYPFFVRSQEVRSLNTYDYDETAIITSGDGVGVGKIFHFVNGKYALHQRAYRIHVTNNNLIPKFLFYYMKATFLEYILKNAVNSSVTSIRRPMINKYPVPVPPMEVQQEIIYLLENLSSLTDELINKLEKEILERKKQYEYYRDNLLKPNDTIPMVTLKEISTAIYRGTGIKRDQVTENGVPCVRYGEIYTTYNTWFDECVSHTKEEYVSSPKYFEHGDILFAITGESVEDIAKSIAYIGHDKCLAGGDIVVMKHEQNPRYLAHVLNTSMAREQKSKGKVKSKVVHSNVSSIEQIKIPLPSLEVQKRYADVLDNFEQIFNDLNIALPAEIEARQKQYEYYRDLLLTFAETGNTILTDRQTDRQTIIKLIQYVFGYAPVKIGDIATIIRGGNFQKKDFVENGRPCIHYGQMYTHFGIYADKTLTYLNDEVFAKSKIAKPGDIIMAVTSENVEDVCSCTAWLGNEEIAVSGHTAIISHNQNAKYLSYYFHSAMFYKQKKKLAHGTKVIEVTPSKLADIEIMLPTLEEQERIVSILDRFDSLCNDLTSGLPAEIEARQKQYEYYRDKLLSFK